MGSSNVPEDSFEETQYAEKEDYNVVLEEQSLG